jgi:hypothetical protein
MKMAFPNGADLDIEGVIEDAGGHHPHNRSHNLNNHFKAKKFPRLQALRSREIKLANIYKPQRDAAGISEVTPVSGCG